MSDGIHCLKRLEIHNSIKVHCTSHCTMSTITDKVWPTTENMCMLHAIYYGLSVEEKALFTCDGKFDPREILLGVVDKKGRTLTHGATTEDAHRMF